MAKKNKSAEPLPLEQLPTPAQVDSTPLDPSAFEHKDGSWKPKATVDEILAKSARGEKLTKEEVAALRVAGLKKNGEKLSMPSGPKDPRALNSDKLLGAIDLFGAADALRVSYAGAAGNEDRLADLRRSVKALCKRLKATENLNSLALADEVLNEARKHDEVLRAGRAHGGGGRRGSRGVDFGITTLNRAIVDMSVIGGEKGDRYTKSVIEHEGVTGIFLALTGEKDDEDEVENDSPFAEAATEV